MDSPPPTILVVEDNAALSRVIQFTLSKAGYDVAQAANGRIALDLAQRQRFDLVVTDQQMPEMTGVELCTCLRDSEAYAQTPIVLLTAKGLELELPQLSEELGIAATFPKPFSPSQLLKTIHGLLSPAVSTAGCASGEPTTT